MKRSIIKIKGTPFAITNVEGPTRLISPYIADLFEPWNSETTYTLQEVIIFEDKKDGYYPPIILKDISVNAMKLLMDKDCAND